MSVCGRLEDSLENCKKQSVSRLQCILEHRDYRIGMTRATQPILQGNGSTSGIRQKNNDFNIMRSSRGRYFQPLGCERSDDATTANGLWH